MQERRKSTPTRVLKRLGWIECVWHQKQVREILWKQFHEAWTEQNSQAGR
jgi:hypothetical protein